MQTRTDGIGGKDTHRFCYYVVMIVIAGLALSAIASGEKKSIQVGPHNVSLDLGTTQEYSYRNIAGEDRATIEIIGYKTNTLIINNSQNFALISIADFDGEMDCGFKNYKNDIEEYLKNLGYDNSKEPQKIELDRKDGYLYLASSSINPSKEIYAAQNWPTSEVNILIVSDFPWDDETRNLIRSFEYYY